MICHLAGSQLDKRGVLHIKQKNLVEQITSTRFFGFSGGFECAYLESLYWCQGACKDLPGQQGFSDQAEHDVDPLTVKVVCPFADLLVLQVHVDGKNVEEDKQGGNDGVDKSRGLLIGGVDRTDKVDHDHNPGDDPGNRAINEGTPVGLFSILVVIFHHNAKQVHHRIDAEDQDQCAEVPQADQQTDQHDH